MLQLAISWFFSFFDQNWFNCGLQNQTRKLSNSEKVAKKLKRKLVLGRYVLRFHFKQKTFFSRKYSEVKTLLLYIVIFFYIRKLFQSTRLYIKGILDGWPATLCLVNDWECVHPLWILFNFNIIFASRRWLKQHITCPIWGTFSCNLFYMKGRQ